MRQTAILAGILMFGSAAFAADLQLLNMVMPGARILAGVNVNNTRISPFGQFVISKVSMLGVEPRKLMAATGFDPLQDVEEVLAASTGDPSKPSGLLLVRGNFNVDKITSAVSALGNVTVGTYKGATLLSVTDAKTNTSHAVAFIGNNIAVAGDLASVETAVVQNGAPSVTPLDPTLAADVIQLSASQDEWLASSVPLTSLIPANTSDTLPPAAVTQVLSVLKSVQSFAGGVNFTSTVQFTGQVVSDNAQNATALGAVIKLAMTFASMGSATNAEVKQLTDLLQNLQVTTSGTDVNVALAVPESDVEALLNQALKPAAPTVPSQERPRRRLNGN